MPAEGAELMSRHPIPPLAWDDPPTITAKAARPKRWLDRAFQIHLPFFMLLVAGSAVAFWGWRFRDRNVDPQGSFLSHQIGELSHGDALSRLTAAESLSGAWAEHLPMALPALLNAARDADPRVRRAVIVSLGVAISGAGSARAREGRIGPEIDAATPALVAALADRDATVRQEAARALSLLKGEFVKPPSQPTRRAGAGAAATGETKVKLVNGVPALPPTPAPVPYGPDPLRVVPALEVAARDDDSARPHRRDRRPGQDRPEGQGFPARPAPGVPPRARAGGPPRGDDRPVPAVEERGCAVGTAAGEDGGRGEQVLWVSGLLAAAARRSARFGDARAVEGPGVEQSGR